MQRTPHQRLAAVDSPQRGEWSNEERETQRTPHQRLAAVDSPQRGEWSKGKRETLRCPPLTASPLTPPRGESGQINRRALNATDH